MPDIWNALCYLILKTVWNVAINLLTDEKPEA